MTIAANPLKFTGISLAIYLAIAVVLIFSQWPKEQERVGGLDFSGANSAANDETAPLLNLNTQSYRHYAGDGPLVVLVHGSGWHGLQFDALAKMLALNGYEVLVPDLRGHGATPKRRGDIEYLGQLEDDLAALVKATQKPGQKVILGGHSSGAGLVVRFAGGEHRTLIDGAILLAPFLKYNAPTTRPNSGGWAQPLTRRIIGLSMLNALRIRLLNHLTVIQFVFPRQVRDGPLGHTITDAYSYRLNTSFAPRNDYLTDIAALPDFLLVAGRNDEAFVAKGYAPLMQTRTDMGQYILIDGVGHLAVVDAPETATAILEFLVTYQIQ